jgi:hypothetical protein
MTASYKLLPVGSLPGAPQNILRVADQANIPPDPLNTDYVAYLAWLAEGNTPDPAD